jgi:hypothetical protein
LRLNSVGIVDEELFNEHETRLSGQALNARIAQEPYYTIFADLKGFPRGEPISDIETYEDFLRSHCEILLLIIDSVYVSVYAKDGGLLNRLYDNAKRKGYRAVEWITDDNDFRTRMSVW